MVTGAWLSTPAHTLNPVVLSGTPEEFLSSTSIFDHVDRLSRGSSDGVRRQGNKVQLIAMQPQPTPPHAPSQPSPSLTEKVRRGGGPSWGRG